MALHKNSRIHKHPGFRLSCILFVGVIITIPVFSQSEMTTQFISRGKIEFERRINQHAFLDGDNVWDEMSRKYYPKFVTIYSDLFFDDNKLLYKPGRETVPAQPIFFAAGLNNIVFTKLNDGFSLTQKAIYGDTYLISGSMRKIAWKIGSDRRQIAGFNCRKAVGRIMDSVVVIAFYTDEITTSGGPESFGGLPGMILGIAIPRLHTTWYATKVQLTGVAESDFKAPTKGKKAVNADFEKQLAAILKLRGHQGAMMQWQIML